MDFDRLRKLLSYSKGANEEDEDDIDGPGANARKIFFNAIQVESFMFMEILLFVISLYDQEVVTHYI